MQKVIHSILKAVSALKRSRCVLLCGALLACLALRPDQPLSYSAPPPHAAQLAGKPSALRGAEAVNYLQRKGWYASLNEAMRATRSGLQSQPAKLTAGDAAAGDQFGHALAISPGGAALVADNTLVAGSHTVVVGAPGDNVGTQIDQGSAYVFVRVDGRWIQETKLTAGDGVAGDQFGYSAAVADNTIVIGAPGVDGGSVKPGAAYVFEWNRDDLKWEQTAKLTASGSRQFGQAVAVSGGTIVVGSPFEPNSLARGEAHVFARNNTGQWELQARLAANDDSLAEGFGASVAIDGEMVVAGDPSNGERTASSGSPAAQGGRRFGAAYVYRRSGAAWGTPEKLTAIDRAIGDRFGTAVAISAGTILVGAPGSDGSGGQDQGAAYVYAPDAGRWSQQAKLTAIDAAAGDQFGASASVSGEGVAVGAPSDDTTFSNAGSAYLFGRSCASWSLQAKFTAVDAAAEDSLGAAVAMGAGLVLAGAPLDDDQGDASGSARVFGYAEPTVWIQPNKLAANDGRESDFFGASLAVGGETAVIGAPGDDEASRANQGSVYVFARDGERWIPGARLTASDAAAGDEFGTSVAISGNTIVVGAPGDDDRAENSGSVYVFTRSGASWSQQTKFTANDATRDTFLGTSVAISDGAIVAGATGPSVNNGYTAGRGAAYVFIPGSSQQAKLISGDQAQADDFGKSVAISGETIVVGASLFVSDAAGFNAAAYVYVRSGGAWAQQAKLTAASVDSLGASVAISGNTVVAGAPFGDTGVAYVFVRDGTAWTRQAKLAPSGTAGRDNFGRLTFGFSVAINQDLIVIGAPHEQFFLLGSAYIFKRSGANWHQEAKLVANDGAEGDLFGGAVAISSQAALVGAPFDDDACPGNQLCNSGSFYSFVRNCPPLVVIPNIISRERGAPGAVATIATISDDRTAVTQLSVTATAPSGIRVTAISNSGGTISANIAAECHATLGANAVDLMIDDRGGQTTRAVLFVNVTPDIRPPTITCPADFVINTSGATAVASYPGLAATDNCPGATITCAPAAGSLLPIGVTAVNCVARDAAANTASCSFNVTVNQGIDGLPVPPGSSSNDQKAGSVLVYNLYTSNSASTNVQNTRIGLTNSHLTRSVFVRLFFVDGNDSSVSDASVCLTPNQTTSFLASDVDPGTTGYLIAVAVDTAGCPINFNHLLGDAYVKLSSRHATNLGAEAFAALADRPAICSAGSTRATVSFDGVSYNLAPRVLTLSNIADLASGNNTLLVVNRLGGNLATGAATLATLFGVLYDDAETPFSFSSSGGCQLVGSLSNTFPRTTPRFETVIPVGRSGWIKVWLQADGGISGAALNFNPNGASSATAFTGGHNLHKLTLTNAASLTIPVLPPAC